jgi:hypothetical protein
MILHSLACLCPYIPLQTGSNCRTSALVRLDAGALQRFMDGTLTSSRQNGFQACMSMNGHLAHIIMLGLDLPHDASQTKYALACKLQQASWPHSSLDARKSFRPPATLINVTHPLL